MEMTGISTSLFRTMMSNVKGDHRKKRRSRSLRTVSPPYAPPWSRRRTVNEIFPGSGLRVIIFEYLTISRNVRSLVSQSVSSQMHKKDLVRPSKAQ